ncbi:MAG: conjugal transfer protein TraF [Pelagibacterales bacterium]|nr:conjugal transfer protein TraF [Pelagibacterales bacterium]
MVKNLTKFLFLILVITSFSSHAFAADYCKKYKLGWNFTCDSKVEEKEVDKDVKKDAKQSKEDQSDYAEQLARIKQTLEDKKAKAVIYPTEDNIKDYMSYQQKALDRSGIFADQWRRVLWKNPELDYTQKRPVSKVGKESWIDQRNQDVTDTIKNINERYGIFFLFNSTCPHCHRYSPILKSFQEKYGITIMPVSMDGGALPEWDNIMVNRGQVERMGIEVNSVPATILFDKETRQVLPVGFGVLSHSELEERIYAITKLGVGDDF